MTACSFIGCRYTMRRRLRECSLRRSEMFIDRTAPEFLGSFRSVIFVALLKELSKESFVARSYKHHAPNGAQNLFSLVRETMPPCAPPTSIYSARRVDGSAMPGAERECKREPPR